MHNAYCLIYIIIGVLSQAVWALGGPMRACDSSLEPSWPKNDQGMNRFWFARATRSQHAKMCFLLHKLAPNGRFEILGQ